MSDLISRQVAIDRLKEHRALYCDNTPDTFSKLSYAEKSRVDELDTAIATLVNLPPAQPEQQWIPCSERLPKENGKYLLTIEMIDGTFEIDIDKFVDNRWDYYDKETVAWMPLPQVYKGDDE